MIKIFSTIAGNRYAYDSLTGRIITIHSVERYDRQKRTDKDLIRQMVADGIIDERQPGMIRWKYTFDEYVRQLQCQIPSLVLELTNTCNLKCQYCAVSGGACNDNSLARHMPEETLMKSLSFFIKHNGDAENAHIGFYGGEALLRFPLIQKSVDYINQNITDKTPTFDISTNGVLLDENIVKWLSDHSTVQVTCTVNGPYHDKYRKTTSGNGSLDLIMANLKYIKNQYPSVWENQIRFIANVDEEVEIPALLDFYQAQLGKLPGLITNIQWEKGNKTLPEKQREHITVDFMSESPMREYLLPTLATVKKRKRTKSTDDEIIGSCFPCRVKMFVHTDGSISFCEQVSKKYSIGDVINGFNLQTLQNLYEKSVQLFGEKCRNCWAQKMCDVCLSVLIDGDGHLLKNIPEEICNQSKASVKRKLQLFCQCAEEAPEFLDGI